MDIFSFFKKSETKSTSDAVGEAIMQALSDNTLTISDADKGMVHIAVAKIAQVASSADWGVYRLRKDGKVEEVTGHILNRLIEKPNPLMTWRAFIYRLVGQREFTGFAPVLIKTVQAGDVRIVALNSGAVKPIFSEDGSEILRYEAMTDKGLKVVYTTEQVKAWFIPDFFSSKRMIGIGDKIKEWILFERAMEQLQRDMAKNRSYVGGVVETNTTSMDKLKQWRRLWKVRVKNRGEDIILPEGAKYTRFSLNAKEMELTAQEEQHIKKVLKAFSVPKELLGDVDTSGRANVDGAYYGFVKFKIKPILDELKEFINYEIVPALTDDDTVFVDYADPTPQDKEFALKEKQVALAGKAWKTPNEVRAEEGLEPLDGGDALSTPLILSVTPPKRVKNAVAKSIAIDNKKKQIEGKVEATSGELAEQVKRALFEKLHKDFTGRVSEKQILLQRVILERANELHDNVVKQIRKRVKKSKDTLVSFDVKKEAETLRISADGIIQALAEQEGKNAFALVDNPAGNYDPKDKKLQRALRNLFMLRAESFNKTTLELINDEVNEGIKEGETAKELEQRISSVFENISKYRAKHLAQDIVFTTANSAIRSAYEQSGVVTKIVWYTAEDEKVCPFCSAMDKRTVGIDEKFFDKGDSLQVGKHKLDLKFEAIKHPPIHSGCRCFLLPEEISF